MFSQFFTVLDTVTDFIWTYPALLIIIVLGFWLTIATRFYQVRKFPAIVGNFWRLIGSKPEGERGVHPVKALFASVGGAIGLGNIIVIALAVQIGGPGAIFWTWITGLLGMMLKYAEVYLGMRFRVRNKVGSYDGGPMYYLRKAFNVRWVPIVVSILLCIYGVEVFMFAEVVDTIAINWNINRYLIIVTLLVLTLWAGIGGVRRVGDICSAIIPIFVVIYVLMALWVLAVNVTAIPAMIALIFKSAFVGHAPLGGFVGSSMLLAMSQGAARGCYSGDIGIGYASVIHSESNTLKPERQANLAIFGIFLDTFVVCTSSILLILVTGTWTLPQGVGVVQAALSQYFPYMNFFMPLFLLLLGYSTITAYLCVGIKCAQFISPRFGKGIYFFYAACALTFFSFFDPSKALIIMTLCGGLLLLLNLSGIFLLRKQIQFTIDS